jgi:uncharacterized protein YnzC (UPF0291/DUF896 family)
MSPRSVVGFCPSKERKARVVELLRQEKSGSLTAAEKTELEVYLRLEHCMRLAKARVKQPLSPR